MAHKVNFTAKTAKALRTQANNEGKGMNHCIKAVLAAWDAKEKGDELTASIKAAKADGVKRADISAAFIIENLTGTKWVDGQTILMNKKGEMTAKTAWTPGAVVDYVRRANTEKIRRTNKTEKQSK